MSSKVAVVTGASRGIGLEVTRALARAGYGVVATARAATREKALEPSERLAVVDGDVALEATAARVFGVAKERFGRVDLLVNNAGIFSAKPFVDYTERDYADLVATNLAGFFHMTQHALRAMVDGGSGHVVNIGTSLSTQPIAGVPSALPILIKGGVEAATRSLAIEYAPKGIRVNTVAAGIVDTSMHPKENHPFLAGLSPANRIARPSEIADAILYLESATFVSGEILHLDGGAHAGKW